MSKEDPKGTGFTNWFSDVAGEVAGYEPTWGRTVDPETGKAKIISDEDINKMLTDIADRNVNSPLSHYQIDPQEFKETLRVALWQRPALTGTELVLTGVNEIKTT